MSLFSFGPIKTQTALGGGLVRLRDLAVREKMLRIADGYRRQTRLAFVARVMKYAYFKFLTSRTMYGVIASLCALFGRDLDSLVRRSVRNFSGDQLLAPIRRRPSAPLVRLLLSRLRRFDADSLRERTERGEQLQLRLQCGVTMPGEAAAENTYWLFPITFDESAPLIDHLRAAGLTRRATTAWSTFKLQHGIVARRFDSDSMAFPNRFSALLSRNANC